MSRDFHHFIIFADSEFEGLRIPELVHTHGYSSTVARSLLEIVDHLGENPDSFLLVNAGGNPSSVKRHVAEILKTRQLHHRPLLFASQQSSDFESSLKNVFSAAVTLEVPFTLGQLGEAIASLRSLTVSPTLKIETLEEDPSTSPWPHVLYEECPSIPTLVFQVSENLQLTKLTLGGENYVSARDKKNITDKSYLPEDSAVLSAFDSLCQEESEERCSQLHRVAYLSNSILTAVTASEEMQENARVASLLYSWEIQKGNRQLLRTDYSTAEGRQIRTELCSRVKDSAMKIGVEFDRPITANIVATIGRLIGREEAATDDEVSICASAIMAADLTERVCWRGGRWNPAAAHAIMSRFKRGELNELHPSVLGCLVKFLVEAVKATDPRQIGTIEDRARIASRGLPPEERKMKPDEMTVSISALCPGMRLARPLLGSDGRTILSENLVLDQDLIWRIWSLSAIRGLATPLVITSN